MTLDLGITRRQRYVSNNTAANVTSSTYARGGTITSYTYSGTTYIAHIFTASGIFTVTSDIYPLDVIAIAGGGGGGNNAGTNSGGGGGGGGIVTNGVLTTINRIYPSSAYIATTTSTQANVVGGWVAVANSVFSDFNGSGAFHFNWGAVQQTAGGARTTIIPELSSFYYTSFYYYMEIGITSIGPNNVAVGLVRDGAPKDGYGNIPYVLLSNGTTGNWSGVAQTALGAFVAGDTLQFAWRSDLINTVGGIYWWVGKNNTWYNTASPTNPLGDVANVANSTGTYVTNGLRLIFMCSASGGADIRGQFRSGSENKYAPPIVNGLYINTITNYTGYYSTPLGSNYVSSGTTYGVTIGAGGGVGAYNPSAQVGAPGSNGGDTVIYNATNPSFYYSTYFSNSYVTATNAAFAFGTGDFTIETWLYPTSSYGGTNASTYATKPIFNSRNFVNPDVSDRGFIVYLDIANKVTVYTSGTTYINTVNTVSNAVWSHIAITRNNNIINVWINGVKDGNSFTASGTQNFTNQNIMIGYGSRNIDLTQASFFTGYFSNYRIVKGLSVYTNNFTPPTSISLATQSSDTNINAITTQTVLLTFNTATIVDLSTLTNVLTQTSGTVSISTFAPFTTSTVLIRAFGGGGGGAPYQNNGQVGGSGGGAPGGGMPGAAIPGQGNQGGLQAYGVSLGSGGGGYGSPGGPAAGDQAGWPVTVNGQLPAGYGGAGGYFNHSGAMVAYSGGGGGGSWNSASYGVGLGGVGGGGNGAYYNLSSVLLPAVAGTVNSGGGGGGSNLANSNAAAGGSGIVIFRYPAFLGDAARNPTDLVDSNLKNTTLLLSSNRVPTSLTPIYSTTASATAFAVDYLIVGGGGGGGGGSAASISTGTGGGGGGAGGVVVVTGYTPPSTFNSMFYADVAYANGSAVYSATVGGWVNTGTDFISSSASGYNWQYDNRGNSAPAAKTTALNEQTSYYIEIYCGATVLGPYSNQTGNRGLQIGLLRNSQTITTGWTGIDLFDGSIIVNDVTQSSPLGAWVTGDILNIAFDPINNKQWFGKNGVWWNGITPGTSGSGWNISGTGYITIGFSNQSSNSSSMQGVFRKSSANTYPAPTGFVPYTTGIILTSSTWTITVGSGGAGGTSGAIPTSGSSGANSSISFSNTNFIAYGGGGGGAPIISTSTSTIGSLSFNSASSQNLTVGTTSDFAFLHNGTQDYTLECWFFTNSTAYQGIMGTASATANVGFTIEIGSGGPGVGAIWAIWQKGAVSQNISLTTAGSQFSTNVWNHLAMTFNATSKFVYMFINGQRTSPASADISTWAFSSANSTYPLNIGYGTSGSAYFSGYITNVRITKSIVYTGIFAVPTSPLTATQYPNPFGGSNTQAIPSGTHLLLTVNSATSYITDSSTNNFSVSNTTGVTYNSSSPPLLVSNYPGGSGASGGGGSYNLGGGTTVSGQGNVGAPTGAMVLAASQSLSFNGSSQYLTIPYSTSIFDWYTSGVNYTIEYWIYPTTYTGWYSPTTNSPPTTVGNMTYNAATNDWSFGIGSATGQIRFYYFEGTAGGQSVVSTNTVPLNNWSHIAMTKTSGGITLFVNGVAQTTTAIIGTPQSSVSYTLTIGAYNNVYQNGYINNLRVVKGTAVYTGNFNVPTLLLQTTQTANPYGGSNVQAISTASYTSLLLTSLTDSSTYGATITNNGSVAGVGLYPPINIFTYPGGGGGGAGSTGLWTANTSTGGSGGVGTYTSIMSTSTALAAGVGQVVGNLVYFAGGGSGAGNSINAASFGGGGGSGSLSFNGTSQALSVANNAAFAFGSGDLTVECWFYQTSFGATSLTLLSLYHAGPGRAWILYTTTAGAVAVTLSASGLSGGTISLNTWNHVAWTRNGANFYLYLNGIQIATVAASTIIASTDPLFIGANNDATSPTWFFPGYISNVRIVKGTAVYTTNFTVPTSPLTNIANTQLLLLVNNDTNKTVDSSNNNFSITNVNGVTYNSSSPVAFVTATNYTGGGGSGAIYGSTSTAGAGGSGVVVIRYPNAQPDSTVTPGVATYINTGGYKTYIFTATGTISFATSATYSTVNYISGYVSGTAITNNRTIIDNSFNNIIINTATTTIAQGTFSPYGSMWSTSFNGSTDYISFVSPVTTGTAFQQNVFWGANKTFTIEAWLNPNNIQLSSTATVILGDVQPTSAGLAWSVGVDPSNKPMMYWKDPVNGNNFITATTTLSTGTWNHVAWVANAGTPTIFVNGVNQPLTNSTISTLTNTTQTYGIVSGAYFNKFYNGSISNLKVSTLALYSPNLSLASSGYFNGSSYLTSATSTAMTFGTNNFTVEFWVLWVTVGTTGVYNQVIGKPATAAGVGFGAGSGRWYMTTAVAGFDTGIAVNTGQWYHVAWVRNLGSVTLYLNGVSSYTTAFATNITDTGFDIGGNSLSGVQYSNVYVSNIRILNGTALYTANFTVPTPNLTNITNTRLLTFLTTSTTFTDYSSTPSTLTASGAPSFVGVTPVTITSFLTPTAPFNATANTILLTCNTYRHIDSSTSSFAISTGTTTSVPKIQKYSPFSMGYAYNPSSIGGSISFNGYSDFLYTTTATDVVNFTGTATSLQFDSDFTVECWIYTTSTAVAQTIFDTAGKEGNTLRLNAFSLNMTTSGQLYFNYNNTTSASAVIPVFPFTWTHIAVTRYSGIMQLWQNGLQAFAVNTTTNYSTGQMIIGRNGPTAASYFSGFISDFRVIKGQAIYTTAFNPPVASLKPIDSTTSTGLLLNFNTVAIADATMNHNVIVTNSATISSSVTKYNPRSIYFPGVAEYLTVVPNSTSSYALGTSDFTVEMWFYTLPQTGWVGVNNLQPATIRTIFDMRTQNTANAGFDIYLSSTGTLNVSTLNTVYIGGTTFINVNTWYHIALTKQSSAHNLYLNGIPEGRTYTNTLTNFINPTVRIGYGAAAGFFNGYIDDVRITRGVARYAYPGFLVPQKSLPVK